MNARLIRPDGVTLRGGAVVVVATILLAAVVLDAPPWLRVPGAVAWTLVVPGLPWALRMRLADAGDTAGATLAISLAATALVGGGMATLHAWSPGAAVLVLAAFALAGALLPDLRRRASRPSPTRSPEVPCK
jgi:hypothetical protein